MENRFEPSFRQERNNKRRQFARSRLAHQDWYFYIDWRPAPLEAVVDEVADRIAMPSNSQVKDRGVLDNLHRSPEKPALSAFAFSALHLVGETINADRAYYGHQTGKLV